MSKESRGPQQRKRHLDQILEKDWNRHLSDFIMNDERRRHSDRASDDSHDQRRKRRNDGKPNGSEREGLHCNGKQPRSSIVWGEKVYRGKCKEDDSQHRSGDIVQGSNAAEGRAELRQKNVSRRDPHGEV